MLWVPQPNGGTGIAKTSFEDSLPEGDITSDTPVSLSTNDVQADQQGFVIEIPVWFVWMMVCIPLVCGPSGDAPS